MDRPKNIISVQKITSSCPPSLEENDISTHCNYFTYQDHTSLSGVGRKFWNPRSVEKFGFVYRNGLMYALFC